MIIDFSIQNFGSVKDKQTLSFEADKSNLLEDYYIIKAGKFRLLKMALIYGANASGKTTILNALSFLNELISHPKETKTETLDFEPYLFDRTTHKQNSILSLNFLHRNVHFFYTVEFNKKCIEKEELYFYKPYKANVFTRTTDVDKQLTKITFGSKFKAGKTQEKILTTNTLWNNTVLAGFLKTNIDIEEIKWVTDWFSSYPKRLIDAKTDLSTFVVRELDSEKFKTEDIVSILKKADFNISGIKINQKEQIVTEEFLKMLEKRNVPTRVVDEIKNQNKVTNIDLSIQHTINNKVYELPFELESQGTHRYFGLAGILLLLISKPVLISIDELESSLHPELYTHFLLSFLANTKESQLIATTHNREILADKDMFRNDAIWFTDKSATGATELYSLADFDTSVIRDTSSVFNAYKIGKLGGVPNLGDYYIDLDK